MPCTKRYMANKKPYIKAVAKACTECDWVSHPTKVPDPI